MSPLPVYSGRNASLIKWLGQATALATDCGFKATGRRLYSSERLLTLAVFPADNIHKEVAFLHFTIIYWHIVERFAFILLWGLNVAHINTLTLDLKIWIKCFWISKIILMYFNKL